MKRIHRRDLLIGAGTMAGAAGLGLFTPTVLRAADPVVMRLSHAITEDTPRHRGAKVFADRLAELSGGEIKVEIYANSQLGSEAQTLQGLQTGTMDFGIIATYANVVPKGRIFELPFLFRDYDHWLQTTTGAPGQEVSTSAGGSGLAVLGYWFGGWRDIYGNREIRAIEDFNGLKIRTQQTPAYVQLFQAAGAIPTPIAWPETYLALQQGTVDASETGLSYVLDAKQYEVVKFGITSRHAAVTTAFLVSDIRWNSLSDAQKESVRTAQADAVKAQNEDMLAVDADVVSTLEGHGMSFMELDTTELQQLARDRIYPAVVEGEDMQATLDAVQAL